MHEQLSAHRPWMSVAIAVLLLQAALGCTDQEAAAPGEASATSATPELDRTGSQRPFFHEYGLDHAGSGPAIVAVDDSDAVWIGLARAGKLARFSNGSVELFSFGADSRPVGVAVGPVGSPLQGTVWIAASYDNKIIRFETATHQTREYKLPGDNTWPFNVAVGADGSVWFTQRSAGQIGRLNPVTGEVTDYPLANRHSGPAGLAVDQRTGKVWFTEGLTDSIGSLDPASGEIREWKLGAQSTGFVSGPAGLAVDADGGVWFAKLEGKIGYLPEGARDVEIFDAPGEARRPAGIAIAPGGDVWALALDGNMAVRYQPGSKTFQTFPLPTGSPDPAPSAPPLANTSRPFGLAFDKQGNLWFSEQYTGKLGVLDIAPPTVEIVSPAATVEDGRVLLSLRVFDRVSGVASTEILVDGEPVQPVQGFLELVALPPGPHTLTVNVTDHAGFRSSAEARFDFHPGRLALSYAFTRLRSSSAEGDRRKQELIALVERMGERDVRNTLERIRRGIDDSASHFHPFPHQAYREMIDYMIKNQSGRLDVRVLDAAPFFDRKELVIRPGDSIRWKYDAPNSGHTAAAHSHTLVVEAGDARVASAVLRSGERFTYKFDNAGTYRVKMLEQPEAVLAINVEEP